MKFYPLKVSAIQQPIQAAITISFEVPTHLRTVFKYYPGQHLILKFKIDGEEVRRSYSLHSCPFEEGALQVTVKRVKGGLISNYVNDQLKVETILDVASPQGRFYADIQEQEYKTYFLFAAGSGITPILAILKSVLLAAPNSAVNLFYGNTDQDTILFAEELKKLQQQYASRLRVVYTLSAPKVWTAWKQWSGRKGRIDAVAVEWFISNHPPVAQTTEYFICGPGAMNTTVKNTLIELGIPKAFLHIEQFGGQIATSNTSIPVVDQAALKATLNGKTHLLSIPTGQTILQTLKAAQLPVPYSCESGICGTCVAKISKGKAEMKTCLALEEQEVSDGWILTCQALPTSKNIEVAYKS